MLLSATREDGDKPFHEIAMFISQEKIKKTGANPRQYKGHELALYLDLTSSLGPARLTSALVRNNSLFAHELSYRTGRPAAPFRFQLADRR
jgi:hypothetical protein